MIVLIASFSPARRPRPDWLCLPGGNRLSIAAPPTPYVPHYAGRPGRLNIKYGPAALPCGDGLAGSAASQGGAGSRVPPAPALCSEPGHSARGWDMRPSASPRPRAHGTDALASQGLGAAEGPRAAGDGGSAQPLPPVTLCGLFLLKGPPGSQPSPHAQPPPHNPAAPMLGPHSQVRPSWGRGGGPLPPNRLGLGRKPPPVGVPGSQPLLPNAMDPSTRSQGESCHPRGPSPPRGLRSNYGSGMRPPPNSLGGPGMPTMNILPGARPWLRAGGRGSNGSLPSALLTQGPPGGGGPPGTPIMPSPGDSTNSSENMYTMMNPIGPAGNRPNVSPPPDGESWAAQALPHPTDLLVLPGSGDMDGLPKSSPSNMAGLSNPPGTPRDDSEMGGTFLNPFQSDSYSPSMTMSV
uniref:Single stranded DNA binding protein 4 n=1 Tax=Chelydra serpentina TaxID=8475 RepID=A0A8C3XJI2_CHESE